MFFSSPNQRYDIIIALLKFVLVSQVSYVAYGPLILCNWLNATNSFTDIDMHLMTGLLATCILSDQIASAKLACGCYAKNNILVPV